MTERVAGGEVELVAVDEDVLDELVQAAMTGAGPDDVTPPIGAADSWSPQRIEWLRGFHRDRRGGLDGPSAEATWAVRHGHQVVGSVRLRATDSGVLETGIWLTHAARGQGLGHKAMALVVELARGGGAGGLRAETTADNRAAIKILRRLDFEIAGPDDAGGVAATLVL